MIKLPGNHLRADLGDITQKIGGKHSKKGPKVVSRALRLLDWFYWFNLFEWLIQYFKALLIKMPVEPKNGF